MSRFAFLVVLLAELVTMASDSEAAFADLKTLPVQVQPFMAYLSLSSVPAEQREQLAKVTRFVVPSLSSKSYLADQIPVAVAHTNLLRIDLQGLGWEKTWAKVVSTQYTPAYRPDLIAGQTPLVVRADWVVAALTDPIVTGDSQYTLLYGTPPKNLAEFQKAWKINPDPGLFFGRIEGDSGVAIQKTRILENHPTGNRGYSWVTFDSAVIAGQTDPLENLTARPPKHDASEAIAAIPKHLGGRAGSLQAYFLADGAGKRQEKAPADIVTDTRLTRGVEIRNWISCIDCHRDGLATPTLDQWREYITSGARVYLKDKVQQQEVDRYLDSPIAKELARNNADYAEAVSMCNGLTPQANAAAFVQVVHAYDAPVTLQQAALELSTTTEELRLALGDYSRTYQLTGRLAFLAQGTPISREQFIANFALLQKVVSAWQAH